MVSYRLLKNRLTAAFNQVFNRSVTVALRPDSNSEEPLSNSQESLVVASYGVLKNRLIGGKWEQYIGEAGKILTSNLPASQIQPHNFGEPITCEELADLINDRTTSSVQASTKLAYGEPDFLPYAFLGRGLRAGVAVCRLVRRYSEAGAEKLIQAIEENNYSTLEVDQLLPFYQIRKKIRSGEVNASSALKEALTREEFWQNHIEVSEAFQADQNYKELLKEIIRLEPIAVGTGFLVGNCYILTNQHVVEDVLGNISQLEEFTAQFIYEKDSLGENISPIELKLDPSFAPISSKNRNEKLDYALVKLKQLTPDDSTGIRKYWDESRKYQFPFRDTGDNLGWLRMSEEKNLVAPPVSKERLQNASFRQKLQPFIYEKLQLSDLLGEPINIIQHPKGREKEIVVYNNRVQEIYSEFIQYETDAEPGSSGSPLLNSQWQLVGIHHSALVSTEKKKVIGYLGTRIHQIVEDLEAQSLGNSELSTFLDKFVRHPRSGRIFLVGGLKRDIAQAEEETKQMEALRKSVTKLLQEDHRHDFEIHEYPSKLDHEPKLEKAITWLNEHDYTVGDVALELVMDAFRPDPLKPELTPEQVRGASVYYVRNSAERKAHAEILIQSLQKRVKDNLPNRGAKSDQAISIENGLPFCRLVRMPSLVLYVGFLTSSDLDFVRENNSSEFNEIALGIKEGLLRWAMSLSPLSADFNALLIASGQGNIKI